MPSRNCSVCGQSIIWKSGEWKFELKQWPYFCSAECALDWLMGTQKGEYPNSLDGCSYVPPNPSCSTVVFSPVFNMHFRSKYEVLVAESFLIKGFHFEYENWWLNMDGVCYLPDFLVTLNDNTHAFVEVKGLWEPGARNKVCTYLDMYGDRLPLVVFPWTLFKSFERFVNANKNREERKGVVPQRTAGRLR